MHRPADERRLHRHTEKIRHRRAVNRHHAGVGAELDDFAGQAGERFGVRNSGATAVVEGIGDHGLEYMTAGTVVVLGPTGRNFGAGMTGGEAFVLDGEPGSEGDFPSLLNPELVKLTPLVPSDIEKLHHLIDLFARHTGSERARTVLQGWDAWLPAFVRVAPKSEERSEEEATGEEGVIA